MLLMLRMARPTVLRASGKQQHSSAMVLASSGISGWLSRTYLPTASSNNLQASSSRRGDAFNMVASICPHTTRERVVKTILDPRCRYWRGTPNLFKLICSHIYIYIYHPIVIRISFCLKCRRCPKPCLQNCFPAMILLTSQSFFQYRLESSPGLLFRHNRPNNNIKIMLLSPEAFIDLFQQGSFPNTSCTIQANNSLILFLISDKSPNSVK